MRTPLTTEDATSVVLAAVRSVAPDLDEEEIDPHVDLTATYDLDSMDFLNLVERVCTACDIDIPERDYPHLASVASFAGYLVQLGSEHLTRSSDSCLDAPRRPVKAAQGAGAPRRSSEGSGRLRVR